MDLWVDLRGLGEGGFFSKRARSIHSWTGLEKESPRLVSFRWNLLCPNLLHLFL